MRTNVGKIVLTAAAFGLSAWAEAATGELLHRWSFNGDYTDSVGGVTATQSGSASWTDGNRAVKLPGGARGTGYVQLGTNILPSDGSPVTLEMWATLDGVQNWGRVFDYGFDTKNYMILAWNYGTEAKNRFEVVYGGSSLLQRDDTLAFETGVKYHIAVTFLPHGDGTTTIRWMRRNAETGALERDAVTTVKDWTLAELTNGHASPFWLGHSQYDHDNDAAATYDEVRVWRGVLNDTQLGVNAAAGPDALPQTADCTPRPTLRIMPLGDSITWGYVDSVGGGSVPGGYRLPLYRKLTALGYNVEFVGSCAENGSPDLPDWDHEGHGGWRVSDYSKDARGVSEHILGWMDQCETPDAVLILLGTNDTGSDDFKNCIARVGALVDKIAGKAPTAHIIVSTLLQRRRGNGNNDQILTLFNPKVAGLVQEHVAKGQRVHYADLCTACPPDQTLSADNLHPHAAGYALVAEGWKDALTNVFPTAAGDVEAPKIARVDCFDGGCRLRVGYGKPVADATIAKAANYAISGVEGVTVTSATVEGDGRTVNLALSAPIPAGVCATLSVTGASDRCSPAHTGPSSLTFRRTATSDYRDNVPRSEWEQYAHVYTFDIPADGVVDSARFESLCSVNRAASVANGFDRIAYCMELQYPGAEVQYAWVSMDAFTDDIRRIGVPTGWKFQQKVSNMNVFCNVAGVVNGLGIATGNIEFWPYAYAGTAQGLGGTGDYDFDDKTDGGGAWGSMQVHNYGAKQTVFAYNSWNKSDRKADVGIGNCGEGGCSNPDWTMCANALAYATRRLHVFVRPLPDAVAPTVVSATAQESGRQVVVTFSEELSPAAVARALFGSPDFVVKGVTLQDDGKTVILDTTTYLPASGITLSVSGVRDAAGNAIAANSSVAVAPPALPAQVRADVGVELDGYELVYAIDIPEKGNFNSSRDAYRIDWSDRTNAFDRVAYYVELRKPGAERQWMWTSCDAFAQQRKMLDVPVARTGITYQREVYNAVVKSNVGQGGIYPRGCNLEFYSCDYSGGPAGIVPVAPPKGVWAWDDIFEAPLKQGWGSMAFNCWTNSTPLWGIHGFGKDGSVLGLGLGSALRQISGHEKDHDWTFGANADQFETRRLYVFVRPTPSAEDEVRAKIGDADFGKFKTLFAINQLPVSCRVNDAAWRANGLYAIDQREAFPTNRIGRVGYYMELQKPGEEPVWIWTAMDNFVTDIRHLGIPEGGYAYKKSVTNLTVRSNSPAVTEVTGASGGCVEFWASSYQPGSDGKYDWDDSCDSFTGSGGYGSMQVHNAGVREVLWALSCFNGGAKPCLGIGNNPNVSENPDWTLKNNADGYTVRKLYCFVEADETSGRAEAERVARAQTAAKVGGETLADYKLLFASESIPTACTGNSWAWMNKNFYTVDNRSEFAPKGFDRVAYFMELQKIGAADSTWVWTAMDPLCDDGLRHGVPYGGYYFKQDVSNLDVRSNCSSITAVTGDSGGCVEFWACGYGVGANGKYDWDDSGWGTGTGYGTMQVHNKSAQQVLWAFNNYQNAATPSIGIGNDPTGEHPDWTFNANAASYSVRRLYCFVRPCTPPAVALPAATGNSIVCATGSVRGDRIMVQLANPISASELAGAHFALDHGVTVKRAGLIDSTHVALYTTGFAAGTDLQLTIAGLVDSNGAALSGVAGTVAVPTTELASLPADIAAAVPALADYRLVQRLDFDQLRSQDVYRNTPYDIDEGAYGGVFDRIAYVLDETPQGGVREWVYVSMDAFAHDMTKIGLPVYERGAWYQQKVANLDVVASANANVTAGTGIATGNIEFWPQSYGGNVSLSGIGGGSSYDWNDTASPFGEGYGSMQVHNWGAGETLLAINRFGEKNSTQLESGIGNSTGSNSDWTMVSRSWSKRTLYVLVREIRNPASDEKGPVIATQPQSVRIKTQRAASFYVHAPDAASYQWYRDGVPVPGATGAELSFADVGRGELGEYSVLVVGADGNRTLSSPVLLDAGPGVMFRFR